MNFDLLHHTLLELALLTVLALVWLVTALSRSRRRNATLAARLAVATSRLSTIEEISDAAEAGTFVVDYVKHKIFWSPTHEILFGFVPGEFNGTSEAFRSRLHPDDRERVIADLYTARQSKKPYLIECRVIHPDGKIIWVQGRGKPVFDQSGKILRVVGVAVDITQRRSVELELELAKQQAEAANKAKSQFLANVSHELRTPLGVIISTADFFLNAGNSAPPHLKRHAITVRTNATKLLRLVDNLLDVAEIEQDRLNSNSEFFAIEEQLTTLIQSYNGQYNADRVRLELVVGENVPYAVFSDADRFNQIVSNLIDNSLKFTYAGSVRVQISTENSSLPMSSLVVDVVDSGIGIAPEFQGNVFEPFLQEDSSLIRQHGGMGVGLTVAAAQARTIGGEITLVESVRGVGSHFRLTIPLTNPIQTQSVANDNPPKKRSLAGKKILIAEDYLENQELFRMFVEAAGAEQVLCANNGQEALAIAADAEIDLILMDMQMPILDGYNATTELRKSGFSKPIIAVTAHVMQGERNKCIDAGCTSYLSKPVTQAVLIAEMADLIEAHRIEIETSAMRKTPLRTNPESTPTLTLH